MATLDEYHDKRTADRTPEPVGTVARAPGQRYVMQKHAASRTHYDLRLELDGVLKSWAVPKGPSYDTAEKRLAVHVEDHPVEYADFEGVIPEGNYGAGAVIVWDRGVWVPIEDPHEGFEKGKLLFELRGYKLRGTWTLVKMKKTEKEWLLIKERDALAAEDRTVAEDSVFSGLTVEELGAGHDPAAPILERLEELGARKKRVQAHAVKVMLAETRRKPFSRDGWLFELKYDGYRMVAGLSEGAGRLITRNGNDASATFPEVIEALERLPFDRLVLDGEVVVHDAAGLPSFQRLQRRAQIRRAIDIARAAVESPATLYLFDLLGFGGYDLRSLPLTERKALLRALLPSTGALRYSDHIEARGEAFYRRVVDMGLEGIMAKKADSAYRGRRSKDWLKMPADLVDCFVIVGFTEPKAGRSGFGALHLGVYDDGALVYAGRAGTGFGEAQLDELRALLDAIERDAPPCENAPAGDEHHWVEPVHVAEVRYKEWTGDALLRHPVFLTLKEDVDPEDCVRRRSRPPPEIAQAAASASADHAAGPERSVQLTNLDKVFWPEEGYTKGDLVDYYRAISDWLLPYLADRPVVLTRYPDGIDGKSFFQKDAPGFAPDWIRRETIWSEGSERELRYFIVDDEPTLVYIANSASIPLHIWASRVPALDRPDWCVLDLDPKDAPFAHVVEVAKAVHALCDEIELPSYAKTSGSSGLHVLVPLGRQVTHEQSRLLGELLARVVTVELPEIATIERVVSRREGRVYVDYLQNGQGKLLVAPYSVRPLPGAPVSAPLRWREVTGGLDLMDYTIRSMPRRVRAMKDDPLRPVLTERPDLGGALQALAARVQGDGG